MLKWTVELPTGSGYYWWKYDVQSSPSMEYIFCDDDGIFMDDSNLYTGAHCFKNIKDVGGLWAGPLMPPVE